LGLVVSGNPIQPSPFTINVVSSLTDIKIPAPVASVSPVAPAAPAQGAPVEPAVSTPQAAPAQGASVAPAAPAKITLKQITFTTTNGTNITAFLIPIELKNGILPSAASPPPPSPQEQTNGAAIRTQLIEALEKVFNPYLTFLQANQRIITDSKMDDNEFKTLISQDGSPFRTEIKEDDKKIITDNYDSLQSMISVAWQNLKLRNDPTYSSYRETILQLAKRLKAKIEFLSFSSRPQIKVDNTNIADITDDTQENIKNNINDNITFIIKLDELLVSANRANTIGAALFGVPFRPVGQFFSKGFQATKNVVSNFGPTSVAINRITNPHVAATQPAAAAAGNAGNDGTTPHSAAGGGGKRRYRIHTDALTKTSYVNVDKKKYSVKESTKGLYIQYEGKRMYIKKNKK
jgi:hypothetical protein